MTPVALDARVCALKLRTPRIRSFPLGSPEAPALVLLTGCECVVSLVPPCPLSPPEARVLLPPSLPGTSAFLVLPFSGGTCIPGSSFLGGTWHSWFFLSRRHLHSWFFLSRRHLHSWFFLSRRHLHSRCSPLLSDSHFCGLHSLAHPHSSCFHFLNARAVLGLTGMWRLECAGTRMPVGRTPVLLGGVPWCCLGGVPWCCLGASLALLWGAYPGAAWGRTLVLLGGRALLPLGVLVTFSLLGSLLPDTLLVVPSSRIRNAAASGACGPFPGTNITIINGHSRSSWAPLPPPNFVLVLPCPCAAAVAAPLLLVRVLLLGVPAVSWLLMPTALRSLRLGPLISPIPSQHPLHNSLSTPTVGPATSEVSVGVQSCYYTPKLTYSAPPSLSRENEGFRMPRSCQQTLHG